MDNDLVEMLRATVEVIEWNNLGLELGLPSYQLNIIKNDSRGVTTDGELMLEKWLDTGSTSWSSLEHELLYI